MSLILDALRKMEQERRTRRGNAQDLRPEVLRYRLATQPKPPSRYPFVIAGAALLLLGGLGAGLFLNRPAAPVVAQAPSAPAPPVAVPEVPIAASPAPAAVPVPDQGVAATVAAPPAARPAAVAAPQPAKAAPVVSQAPAPPEPQSQPKAYRENVAAAGGQDIVISGIAYQDERRLRRAVLNGVLVGEGAEVAGARVVEIRETKVRLSRGGRLFDVPFSSGLQSR